MIRLFKLLTYSLAIFFCSGSWALMGKTSEPEKTDIYRVRFLDKSLGIKAAISFHNQVLEAEYEDRYLVMELAPRDVDALKSFGLLVEKDADWAARYDLEKERVQGAIAAQKSRDAALQRSVQVAATGIPGHECYETVEETFSIAENYASQFPMLAEWIDIGNSWLKDNELGGYDLKVLKLTNKSMTGEKPILFINSAIHAREYATAPLSLAFVKYLVEGYGIDADATWILDHHEVHLLLQSNPDGRKQAEAGVEWRKNYNLDFCPEYSATNAGVDLNRNFSFSWGLSDNGSSAIECSETFRGPSAGSEPEIQAIENYLRSIFADRRGPNDQDAAPDDTSGIHLDIHSYSKLVLWPWGHSETPAPNAAALQTLGRKFAWFNGYNPQQSIGLYPTNGTSDGISYGELGVAAYTFELGSRFFESCENFESTIKPDNLPALIYAAKVVRTPYVTSAGPDITQFFLDSQHIESGEPVQVLAVATDKNFSSRNGAEPTENIVAAEAFINTPPWVEGAVAAPLTAFDSDFDRGEEFVSGVLDTEGLSDGKHLVYLRAQDANGIWGAVSSRFLYVGGSHLPPDEPLQDYCPSVPDNANYEWIKEVKIGSFVNGSGASQYSDYTDKQVPLKLGNNSFILSSETKSTYEYVVHWKVFIDLNQDGDFSDPGEEVIRVNDISPKEPAVGSFPLAGLKGPTRMRVSLRFGAAAYTNSCDNYVFGEVEDYTVYLVD